jgi:hypothetical protein
MSKILFAFSVPFLNITTLPSQFGGARWRSWLRHYATNRNVAGSNPDGVTGINSLT